MTHAATIRNESIAARLPRSETDTVIFVIRAKARTTRNYRSAAVLDITTASRPYTSSTKLSASPDGVAVR